MKRYIAQTRLSEIGEEGQKRLGESHVLVVGCGALGAPVAMYLAGAGIGHITVADFDTIDITNLHRQVFYTESEAGLKKSECLANKMKALNSSISVSILDRLITKNWLEENNDKFNIIVDAADNPSTTYLLDEYCAKNRMPLSTAGVSEWSAQIFVYNPGSARYSEIFSQPTDENGILPCSIAGIAGPVAAFAAALQAADVIKCLTLITPRESSRLICANLLTGQINVMTC